jgi:hypothetical protein
MIYYRFLRRSINQKMLEKAISIKAYSKKYNYSISGVRHLIATKRVVAFKWGKGLYIVDALPLMAK